MKRRLDSVKMKDDLILKDGLPRVQTGKFTIKNKSIMFLPNIVGCNHKDFHEEGKWKGLFCQDDFLEEIDCICPSETERASHLQAAVRQSKNRCSRVSSTLF